MTKLFLAFALLVPLFLVAPGCGGGSAPAELVGTWQGINGSSGQLKINSDGSYTYSVGGGGGEVSKTATNKYSFSGTLASWGSAHLDSGVIVFDDQYPIAFYFAKI